MSVNIYVGGNSWTIRPLTIRQLSQIQKVLNSDQNNIEKSVDILKIGLSRDCSGVAADLDNIEGTLQEIDAAAGAVLELGGFLRQEIENGQEA